MMGKTSCIEIMAFEELGIDLAKVPLEHLADYTAVEYYLNVSDEDKCSDVPTPPEYRSV